MLEVLKKSNSLRWGDRLEASDSPPENADLQATQTRGLVWGPGLVPHKALLIITGIAIESAALLTADDNDWQTITLEDCG